MNNSSHPDRALQGLAYLDELVQEYLLFRGFTASWQCLSRELASDCSCEFQAKRLADLVMLDLIPNGKGRELVQLLDFLDARLFSHLPAGNQQTVRKLEAAVLQLFLVVAVKAGAHERVSLFFSAFGERLLRGGSASLWQPWFALPFLSQEAAAAQFKGAFSREAAAITETALRNLLAEATRHMALPKLLRFETDRAQRHSLQAQLAAAQDSIQALQLQLQQQQQPPLDLPPPSQLRLQQPSTLETPVDGASPPGRSTFAAGSELPLHDSPGPGAQRQHSKPDRSHAAQPERRSSQEAAGGIGRMAQGGDVAAHATQQSSTAASHDPACTFLHGHAKPLVCCSFSPSGSNLATAAGDGVVRIWAPDCLPHADKQRAAVLQCGAPVTSLAWDRRAGKLLLVGMQQRGIKAWHLDTRQMVAQDLAMPATTANASSLEVQQSQVMYLATSPAEPVFAASTAGPGQQGGAAVSFWNMRAFKRVHSFSVAAPVSSLAYAADGRSLATLAVDGTATLLDSVTRKTVMSWQAGSASVGDLASLVWLNDVSLATLTPDKQLRTWDIRKASAPISIGSCNAATGGSLQLTTPHNIAASPDGRRIVVAAASANATLPIFPVDADGRLSPADGLPVQLADKQQQQQQQVDGSVCTVDWLSNDSGSFVAAGTTTGAAVLLPVDVS